LKQDLNLRRCPEAAFDGKVSAIVQRMGCSRRCFFLAGRHHTASFEALAAGLDSLMTPSGLMRGVVLVSTGGITDSSTSAQGAAPSSLSMTFQNSF
jgi:hypothetical protein